MSERGPRIEITPTIPVHLHVIFLTKPVPDERGKGPSVRAVVFSPGNLDSPVADGPSGSWKKIA